MADQGDGTTRAKVGNKTVTMMMSRSVTTTLTATIAMTSKMTITTKVIHTVGAVGNDDHDNNDDNNDVNACFKVIHTVGAVGRVEWRDLGGHNYSGVFKGAQHGLVRSSL